MAPAPPQTQPPSPQQQRGSQLHPHPTLTAQRPGHPSGAPPVPPHTVIAEPPPPVEEPPPEHTYPCGCGWPGTHKQDCMWSLWEQMRDNYLKTKDLMGKFMTSANTMQEATREGVKCQCPAGCHGTDLGKAMGLQQMTGVTLPWDMTHGGLMGMGTGTGVMGGAAPPSYSVENEARKLMEEQKRIKNTWVQFLSIFDMALDMANDVSKDRWEQNRRRKERQRLEREQRLEEMRKERLERQKGSKPEPPPERAAGKDDEVRVEDKNKDKLENQQDDKSKAPAESPKEEENAPPAQDEKPAEDEPAPEEQPAAEEAEEG